LIEVGLVVATGDLHGCHEPYEVELVAPVRSMSLSWRVACYNERIRCPQCTEAMLAKISGNRAAQNCFGEGSFEA